MRLKQLVQERGLGIRQRLKDGLTEEQVGAEFGITADDVRMVLAGSLWGLLDQGRQRNHARHHARPRKRRQGLTEALHGKRKMKLKQALRERMVA